MDEKSKLEEVYSAWQNNPQFRQEFKTNPEQALLNAGLKLSQSDLEKVQSMLKLKNQQKTGDDSELEKRINK